MQKNNIQKIKTIKKRKASYQKNKERARNIAIEYQAQMANKNQSYSELLKAQNKFEVLGKKYGLLTEFRDNGII